MAYQSLYSSLKGAAGFLPLYLHNWRLVASNDVPAIAVASGNGGNLGSDTSPALIRANGATDKALRIKWASSTSVELFQQVYYPPDLDVTTTYAVSFRIGKSANTDSACTFTVGCFEGVGDTNRGSATAVLATATVTTYTCTVTPTTAHPMFAVFTLTPGTHTTDDIWLYEAYLIYTKKLVSA